ncbi:hypothetical protein NA56DRAFT_327336 [Hyaloscypha hepaticicola]|uniref:BZIP domain-containing protein n=1 Tax=Hyaloscypha hepaticicola TaxID=2082293 RepID=A0A2J6PP94_9HELO|nr:hypothetical protein NA56DRAFT_327336 [Hyaloscypha hepaticicola]
MESELNMQDYPWVSYQDWNENQPNSITTPASVSFSYPNTSYTNSTSETFTQQASTCKCEIKDLTASKLQKRREQNRTSQQKFRERTRKEYEALEQALEAERQLSARLRDEVTALHSTIECLAKGNQNCLETISRLFMSGYNGNADGEVEMERCGQLICGGFDQQIVSGGQFGSF